MKTTKTARSIGIVASLLLILSAPVHATAPQASSGTILELETATGGQVAPLKLSLGDGALRMDVEVPGQGSMSIVWTGSDDDGKMLMMMHDQKNYMEFTAEMMAGMAGMMGQMPPQVEAEAENTTPPTFTRTGNTKQVGDWSAYEVQVRHPDQDGDVTMWFSQDVDADFRSLAEQVMTSMSTLLDSPMMQMAGGGGGNNVFDDIEAQLNAVNMPDGFPVQIVSSDGAVTTLKGINQSASFDATTWQAPAGYTKMAMPFGR